LSETRSRSQSRRAAGFIMNGFQKILVVDNGERGVESGLSAELAEMGFASVTTPFEAADDVLAMIPSPAAVVLQMPRRATVGERDQFLALAERLRLTLRTRNIPVIVVNEGHGAHASLLHSELGTRVLSNPEL
jgi:hypothetical protein